MADVTRSATTEVDAFARRLAAIVESSSDAIVSKTLDGVITSWNAGAEGLYGYSRREAIGQPVEMLIPRDRAPEEQTLIDRLLGGEPVRQYETERRRKDGSLVPVWLTASLITGAGGEVLGVATIARDKISRLHA